MKLRDVVTWAVLLLVPAVPVFAFYLVFKESNFVEVHELPSGVVAGGPIAAYFILLWIGSRLAKDLDRESPRLSPVEGEMVGTAWLFEAKSQHGSRHGKFKFSTDERGRLSLSGNFMLGEVNVGAWESTMAQCSGEQLRVLYSLTDSGKGKDESSRGILSMSIEPDDPDKMTGSWGVVGSAEAFGELKCQRIGP